jgi:S1-C subfamily serine protease
VEVDGKKISSSEELVQVISTRKPGDEVEISFYRGTSDKQRKATVKLGKRPSTAPAQQQVPRLP